MPCGRRIAAVVIRNEDVRGACRLLGARLPAALIVESMPRPIRPDEVAVIRAAIRVSVDPELVVDAAILDALESLMVVSACGCGCPSVRFRPRVGREPELALARAGGVTPAGEAVLIFVFGRANGITELEIAPMEEPTSGLLPTVASISA